MEHQLWDKISPSHVVLVELKTSTLLQLTSGLRTMALRPKYKLEPIELFPSLSLSGCLMLESIHVRLQLAQPTSIMTSHMQLLKMLQSKVSQ